MYLPTLPSMAEYFGTSASMVQLGLSSSMAGLAIGQLLFGPISDSTGRKPPLVTALVLFLAATAGCIYAADIKLFIAMRLVQGIAGAGGIVIARSIASDIYTGRDLAAMLAVIGAINGIAPVTAPVIGGEHAGAASALLGASGFAAGGLVSPLAGIGDIMISSGILFVAGSVLSSVFAIAAVRMHTTARDSLSRVKN